MKKFLLYLVLSGCGYSSTNLPYNNTSSVGGGGNGTLSKGDFATVKAQVFQNYCFRCHSQAGGNKGGVNLETFAQVKPIVQRIRSAVESGFMPQSGVLPTPAKTLLLSWIDSGAPEFASAPAAGSTSPNPMSCNDQQFESESRDSNHWEGQDDCDQPEIEDQHNQSERTGNEK